MTGISSMPRPTLLVVLLAGCSFGPLHVAGINGVPLSVPIFVADVDASAGFGNPSPVASLVHTLSPTASFSGAYSGTTAVTAADKAIDGNRNTEAQFIFDTEKQGTFQEATLSLDFHALTAVHKLGFEQSSNVDSFRVQLVGLRGVVKWSTVVYERSDRYVFVFNGSDSTMNDTAETASGPINGVTSLRIVPLSVRAGQPDLGVTEIEMLGWYFGSLDQNAVGVRVEMDTGIIALGADLGVRIEQTPKGELRTPNPIWSQGVDIVGAIRQLQASSALVNPTRRWYNEFQGGHAHDSGLIPDRTLRFEKSTNSSSVRAEYFDVFRFLNGWCNWELLFDGAPCPSRPIYWKQYSTASANVHTAKTIVGYCDGVPAGVHEITVQVSGSDCQTGESDSRGFLGVTEALQAEPPLIV